MIGKGNIALLVVQRVCTSCKTKSRKYTFGKLKVKSKLCKSGKIKKQRVHIWSKTGKKKTGKVDNFRNMFTEKEKYNSMTK